MKQQKDGRWGAADGIAPGEHRSDFRWEYGTDYRMSIAVSRTAVTGTLRTMDGNEAAKITVPRTPGEAVTSGRAALRTPDIFLRTGTKPLTDSGRGKPEAVADSFFRT